MGQEIIQKLIPLLKKIKWPQNPQGTAHGATAYEVGMEKLASYDNNPKVLTDAMQTFLSGDSAPYAYAGVAYTLIVASAESDGSYAQPGLDMAMKLLEKAQATEPDVIEINVIEAYVYMYGERMDDARLVLNYLHQQEPENYYVHSAEVAFWQQEGDLEQIETWIANAMEVAVTIPQKWRMRSLLGDVYMEHDALDKALALYKEGIHNDNKDYRLWHKISMVYWKQENIEEAERANQMALRLQDFPAGRKMAAAIQQQKKEDSGGGFGLGKLFGR